MTLLHMAMNVFWAVFFLFRPTSFFQVAKTNSRLPTIGFRL